MIDHVTIYVTDLLKSKHFYEAALAADGQCNGAPGLRPQYTKTYYAAFIIDPNGHNIEAVFDSNTNNYHQQR